jgi:thioredoxin-related protein
MKKMILTGLVFIALIIASQSFAQELTWYNWEEGYAKAQQDNKIMLIDAYTDWCGWCKVMDQKTYTKAEIIDLIEKEFVPIKLNPELEGSYEFSKTSYTGRELIDHLSDNNFRGYPTTFFVFSKTDSKYMEVGYKDADAFKIILEKYAEME